MIITQNYLQTRNKIKMQIETIGVIGASGYVGQAVTEGFCEKFDVETYDIKPKDRTCNSLVELAKLTNIFFICVPTPMNKDGSCHTNIVETIVKNLDVIACNREKDPQFIAVIKSTIPPGTTKRLNNETKRITCVHNGEFLTEANFIEDFLNQDRIIIGGPRPASTVVRTLYNKAFPNIKTIKTSSTMSELVKYFTNCFLATKLSFANEFYQVCEALDEDYDKVLEYALYDKRLGQTHFSVPSNETHPETGTLLRGWALACFPKDLNAMISLAKSLDIDPKVMQAVWDKNCEVRQYHDWNDLVGRAVVDEQD
ncbi:hypothetical protein CMI47_03870 [Candidatus Pacearchaeota archaeon]|nr:hypothetical protein [Candidatus Pacearchaeota archaeon]